MAVMDRLIYLDHNATTPVLPEVVEAMRACYEEPYLNPASQHEYGRRARRTLEAARERIAELLGAKTTGIDADQVLFTSGGTEANNLAVRGLLASRMGRLRRDPPLSGAVDSTESRLAESVHLIVSLLEHPSIAALADELASQGVQVDRLTANSDGVLQAAELSKLLRPGTRLLAAMLGQNETGVLQPIAELATTCAKHNVLVHTDAAQVIGKIPVDFRKLGVATMTVAAHKFHGPVGIGALLVRHGVELRPQLVGGFQQASLRPGTEPVALAVGLCRALELWHDEGEARVARLRQLRDHFEKQILAGWPSAVVIGRRAERLPQTSNIAFVGLDRQALFMALDQAGVACSTGSACASGSSEASPAHVAMGLEPALAKAALRFSFGATSTVADADEASCRILRCCNNLGRQKRA